MSASQSTESLNATTGRFSPTIIRRYATNRWILLAAAGLALVGITAMSWSWLVAAGIASVLLSFLPCLVMCGLGLCMHKFMGGSSAPQTVGSSAVDPSDQAAVGGSVAQVASCCAGTGLGNPPNALAENVTTQSKEKTHA